MNLSLISLEVCVLILGLLVLVADLWLPVERKKLLGYAAAVTAFPFVQSFPALCALRFADGACSVGVWVSCETFGTRWLPS